jgi:hypothetical protein
MIIIRFLYFELDSFNIRMKFYKYWIMYPIKYVRQSKICIEDIFLKLNYFND